MEEIRSFDTVIWSEPDEKHRVRAVDTAKSKEIFTELESHLASKGLLPDEYFMLETKYESNDSKMPMDYEALCIPNYGSSEGIYVDIYLIYYENDKKNTDRFACGKTLDESADAFYKMAKTAAECSLMLNGCGQVYQKQNTDITLTPAEVLLLDNVIDKALQIGLSAEEAQQLWSIQERISPHTDDVQEQTEETELEL